MDGGAEEHHQAQMTVYVCVCAQQMKRTNQDSARCMQLLRNQPLRVAQHCRRAIVDVALEPPALAAFALAALAATTRIAARAHTRGHVAAERRLI